MATIASNLYATSVRLNVVSPETGANGTFDGLYTAWKRYRTYRATLSALKELPDRTLEDLNFNRGDLAEIARREVYGR